MEKKKRSLKLRLDEWISAVRPDAKSPPEPVIVLEGFIGKSSERGHVRLYFDEALNQFIDVAEKDILYATPLDKEESPQGGSKLWVKGDAVYTYGDPAKKERPRAAFMQGDIMAAYEQQAAGPVAADLQPFISRFQGCLSRNARCVRSVNMLCRYTDQPTCRSVNWTCYISCHNYCDLRTRKTCLCPEVPPFEITPYVDIGQVHPTVYQGAGFEQFNPYRTPYRGF